MRRLGVVVFVGVGLFAIVQALALVPSIVSQLFRSHVDGLALSQSLALDCLAVALLLALGAALIVWRGPLSAWLFEEGESAVAVDPVTLLRVGFVLLGIGLVIEAIPSILMNAASFIVQAAQLMGDPGDESSLPRILLFDATVTTLVIALRLALGLVLVIGARGFATRLLRSPVAVVEAVKPAVPAVCPSCGAPYDPADYRDGATARCVECREPLPVR